MKAIDFTFILFLGLLSCNNSHHQTNDKPDHQTSAPSEVRVTTPASHKPAAKPKSVPKDNSIFSKRYRDITEFECFTNYKEAGSTIIGNQGNQEYGISQIKKGRLDILLLNRVYPGKKATFEILDTLQIRNLKNTEYISCQVCRKDKVQDSEIIAIVVYENKEYFSKVLKAWRANRKTGKITSISVKGIDCLNEGYGI